MKVLPGRMGMVYLVGAGPGDPELITLRGLRVLRQADVVVFDRLIDPRLLAEAREDSEKICVGKRGGHYTFPQSEINRLVVDRASKGRQVVRLKGGDPFLFGRGGEEALHLLEAGVPFEVVPGVSAAFAVPGSAGIPVTFRGVSSSVAIVSGHQAPDSGNSLNWSGLASVQTLVVMMPLLNLRPIVAALILHGRSLSTPAAVIQSGTRPDQQTVSSTLRDIVAEVERAGLVSPAILVVGEVVRLYARLRPPQQSARRPEDFGPEAEAVTPR